MPAKQRRVANSQMLSGAIAATPLPSKEVPVGLMPNGGVGVRVVVPVPVPVLVVGVVEVVGVAEGVVVVVVGGVPDVGVVLVLPKNKIFQLIRLNYTIIHYN